MVLTVRPAISADAPAMADLLNEVVRAGGTTAILDPLSPADLRDWFIDGSGARFCHLAEDEGLLLGWQSVGYGQGLPAGWGDMATFARVGGTGRGIGTALFAATLARARAEGLMGLNATIRSDNTGGLAYYTKMGFADHAVTKGVELAPGLIVDKIHKRMEI